MAMRMSAAALPVAIWGSEGAHPIEAPDAGGVAASKGEPTQRRFSPYEYNGGTAAAIAGDDFVVVASDTRLCAGYEILSRSVSKCHRLSDHCVISTGGCWTDVQTLHKVLDIRGAMYLHNHGRQMGTRAFAQLLSNTLYYKRFFPYYAFNVLAGLDEDGKGAVYTYDAVGSFERTKYACQGAGQQYIIPLLDNLVGHNNREDEPMEMTIENATNLIKEAYTTAGERDTMTGDGVDIWVVTRTGVTRETFELKKD